MNKKTRLKRKEKLKMVLAFLVVFVLSLVYLWDLTDQVRGKELRKGSETLANLAVQGAALAEEKIGSAKLLLRNAAWMLEDKENFKSDTAMDYLRNIVADQNADFVRIGVVDLDGNARVTDGRRVNVEDRKFFRNTIQGKEYVSSVIKQADDQRSIAVSVPLYDDQREIRGVLYGIITTDNFHLYDNTLWNIDEEDQYIHIIDQKGNYIVRTTNKNSILEGSNLYAGLDELHSTVSIQEIKEKVKKQEVVLTRVHRGDDERYVYFAPMKVNNWSVVTVLTGTEIQKQTGYSQKSIMTFLVKLITTLFIFGIICYKIMEREMRRSAWLNQELSIVDRTFRTAISEIGNFVFTYDPKTEILEFVNYNGDKLPLPKVIEHFPENYCKYIVEGSKSSEAVERILHSVEAGQDNIEDELLIKQGENIVFYRAKLMRVADEQNEKVLIVGVLDDITMEKEKEIRLRDQAGRDSLTKVYNRGAGYEEIKKILDKKGCAVSAFMIIDLDNFKEINDTMGHMVGDRVLIDVVQIIKNHVYQKDIVCRLGGDEFVVFLVNIPPSIIESNVAKLLDKLNFICEKDGVKKEISASIGISLVPENGTDVQTLYAKADMALYDVKKKGKNNYKIYQED